jgi:hypothetical protein
MGVSPFGTADHISSAWLWNCALADAEYSEPEAAWAATHRPAQPVRPQHGGLGGDGYWPETKLYRWLCDSSMTGQGHHFSQTGRASQLSGTPGFSFQFGRTSNQHLLLIQRHLLFSIVSYVSRETLVADHHRCRRQSGPAGYAAGRSQPSARLRSGRRHHPMRWCTPCSHMMPSVIGGPGGRLKVTR